MNRSRPLRRLPATVTVAILGLLALASAAQAERELDQRFFANERGNITMAANSLTTCSTVVSNCLQRRERAPATNLNNGAIQMQFNDVDGDPTTKSSAKAMLNLPAGAEVLFAGLYWGGRPELKPTGSEFNVTPAEFGQVKFAVPGGAGYQPISAGVVDEINFGDNGNTTWQGFADVTSLVNAAGPGEYMVGGVRVEAERITSNGTWGGWALVVAYSDPAQPWRNLVVYDGLKRQLSGGNPTNIAIEGFRTPPAPAAVNSTVGVVAYEGDASSAGDSANFVQDGVEVPLEDALNPANNFFNSMISREGTDFGDRSPNYSNNYSFDAKLVNTVNALKNSTTEATLRVKTGGDGYATGALTMATELFTPKVALSKSVENITDPGAPFAHPGDILEYEITAQNQASTPAEPVDGASSFVIGDVIPAGLNYVPGSLAVDAGPGSPATPTDTVGDDLGEYDGGGDEVRFRVGTGANGTAGGTLASGETTTVRFQAEIDLSFPGGEIDNEAVANYKAATLDIPLQDNAKASSLSEPLADLTIEKTASPELVTTVPSQVTYTLAVENKGPGTSASTVVTDQLPTGLEYVSDDAGCDTSALPKIECDLGTMIAGASDTIQIVAEVPSSTTGAVVKNTAKVEGATPDLEPKDNEDTATVEIEPLSDLAVTKTTPAISVKPGDQLTYFLTAENKGPTTELVTVTDTLPADLEYVSDNGACDTSALPEISCEIGMQEKGKSNTITLVTKVLATGGVIENTAKVSGALNPDPEPKNDESTATTPVEAVSDLAIEKTVSAPSAKPSEQLTYTLEVENKGPSTSNPTTVTDTLPAGLVYVSDDSGCETAGLPEVICNVGSLASGASKTIELVAEVAPSATGTLENTAEVTGPNVDPEPGDNEDGADTTVEPVADLAIEKTASAPAVKPGEQLTYTLAVENKGPSASPATLTDTLPAQLTYVSDDSGCDVSALPAISCELGSLASGAGATVELLTEVKADASGTIENTAVVTGPHSDPTPADNESTATSSITPLASDLALTKSAPGVAVKAGDQITYTLVASNHGPDPSPQTVLTDTLPPQLTYVSDDAGCDTSALPEVECELGTLADGESQTVHIVAKVAATDGQPIQNKARVSGANADPELANNPDAAQVPLAPLATPPPTSPPAGQPPASKPPRKPTKKREGTPRLTLSKTAGSARARPGAVVSYRITVANKGDAPARKVVVCDHPPASQRTLRTEPKAASKAKPCWRVARLAPGAKRSFTLTAMVKPGSDRGTQRNRATATAANVKGVRADTAAVRVKPLPQTGCLARPLGGLADVEFLC